MSYPLATKSKNSLFSGWSMLCNSPSLMVNPSFHTFNTTSSRRDERLVAELRDGIT